MAKDVVAIYKETGNFHKAVRESGLSPYHAHIKLMKSGVLKIQDKINYGTKSARLGGMAEKKFQDFMPDAIDANKYFQQNNPGYDFVYRNMTIDVKYTSLKQKKGAKTPHWSFRAAGEQDFTVVFAESEKGKELTDPIVLVLPYAFTKGYKGNMWMSKGRTEKFKVSSPEEMKEVIDMYADIMEEERKEI